MMTSQKTLRWQADLSAASLLLAPGWIKAPVEQTAQRVTLRGGYATNFLAILGGTLRDRFLEAPIRPADVRSAHA
ncbi:hypothetical protein [Thiorhodococcus minor]|uniref:Uncharacterized protein n=1 Tax=Thiorhodococcus minor TaxID=57489 RepID=A0A6M0K704_9GAMM|nr:hypothetical protein [Thiorhodococcus minor]NEV65269.1 hypothetical protein [Thiorhodococcus minor]